MGALAACARDAVRDGEAFVALTTAEAETLRAFAARILPTDELPGAEEAGAVYFADRALAGPFAFALPGIQAGLAELDARAARHGVTTFAALSPEAQDEVMRGVEDLPFFADARMLAIFGTLADPTHGGNRSGAAEQLAGIAHPTSFQPPFGYYDQEYLESGGGQG